MSNLTVCNNCAGSIVLSLQEHSTRKGLNFCCEECADHFFSPDNLEPYPVGLTYDFGVEEYS